MDPLIFITSLIIGFFVAIFFAGKKEGKQGIIKSLILKTSNHKFHIHHWISSLAILIILNLINFYNDYIFGFLIGITIQGLMYKDFYKIIYKNP